MLHSHLPSRAFLRVAVLTLRHQRDCLAFLLDGGRRDGVAIVLAVGLHVGALDKQVDAFQLPDALAAPEVPELVKLCRDLFDVLFQLLVGATRVER